MRGLPAQERKNQILDQAQRLFIERGYSATTVGDILNRSGIAKGTLYHHFSSKEDIMRQLIARTTAQIVERAEAVAGSDAAPVEKLLGIIAAARVDGVDAEMIEELHAVENTDFHVHTLTQTVIALTPILARAVSEGVEQGVFDTPNPVGDCYVLLTAGFMLLDQGLFPEFDQQEQAARVFDAAERLLGCAPGAIATAMQPLQQDPPEQNPPEQDPPES